MAEQRINLYVNEFELLGEMFDEIGRNFPALWHPENEDFHMKKIKLEFFEQILNHLEITFPGRVPPYFDGKFRI